MSKLATVALLTVLAVSLATAHTGQAADPVDCSDFTYQEDAQAYLNANPSDPGHLDTNHNGIACQSLPHRPTASSGSGGLVGWDGTPAPLPTYPSAQASAYVTPSLTYYQAPAAAAPIASPTFQQKMPLGVSMEPPPRPILVIVPAALVAGPLVITPPNTGDGGLQ